MPRILRRLIGTVLFCYLMACLSIALFAALQAAFEPEKFTEADVIVVLGAGMDPDGTLHQSTILRVEKGVALFHAGAAPKMHFTGGKAANNGPGAGDMMAQLAKSQGVPAGAISTENDSLSTLQNALFSQSLLGKPKRIILVTEGFHLPRSWASFHWAAWQTGQTVDIALARSVAFRTRSPNLRVPAISMVAREGIAWAYNLGRLAIWHGGAIAGVPRIKRDQWLQ